MSALPAPRADLFGEALLSIAQAIANALRGVLPPTLSCKLRLTVDRGRIDVSNVVIEARPPQAGPRRVM